MRARAALFAALLVAGCMTNRGPGGEHHWLVGTWLMLGEDVEHPLACESGLPIRYSADGAYRLFEESGRWRIEGDRLIETAARIDEDDDGSPSRIGRPYTSRVERTGADEFRKTFADGATETFRRCPES